MFHILVAEDNDAYRKLLPDTKYLRQEMVHRHWRFLPTKRSIFSSQIS